jgi:ATP-dependent helicase/nuclease subunit A
MDLTSEQAEIVDDTKRNVVVTAGAGSGKTRMLVESYVHLLDECDISEIAAVTFTDAAASEMRDRVRHAVLSEPTLERHRPGMDDAVIGTIHSLCRRILREHPVEAALDPQARVLADDEAEAALLVASIDALEETANADDLRLLCLQEIGTWGLKHLLPKMVSRRDEVRAAFASMPGETTTEWAAGIKADLDRAFAARVESMRAPIVKHINAINAAFGGDTSDLLWGKFKAADAALGNPNAGNAAEFAHRLQGSFSSIDLRGGSGKNWSGDLAGARSSISALRELAREVGYLPQWSDYDETALRALESLRLVFEDACSRYATYKQELVAVDYLDLEIEVQTMLAAHPEVAMVYHRRFKHLLVDELQDTNSTQVRLIELLSKPAGRGDPAPKLFLVGDIKQAIYRFRGSDVSQFSALCDTVARIGGTHSLTQSFRTHDPLVYIFNTLFTSVFGEATRPFEAPMEAMIGRGGEAPTAPYLTIIQIEKPGNSPYRGTPSSLVRRVEADQVAAEIEAMLIQSKQVWDKDEEVYRGVRPGDFAILLRRLANLHIFEEALANRGIAYRTPAGAGFFRRQEVLDLTNLLGWLAEPDDDIALVGALRSPLFMIDDGTLLKLRQSNPFLLASLRQPPASVPVEVHDRCIHATKVLDELRSLAQTQQTDVLLEKALSLTDFEASWAPLQGGKQALANIRKLLAITRHLGDRSIDEVVDYLKARRDELDAREGLAIIDDSDAVRLMTVHSAKGLEFPVVFIPESDLNHRNTFDSVRWRTDDGISLTLAADYDSGSTDRRRPGFYSYLAARDDVEDEAEHKRLFYVAATRAADALVISGQEKPSDGSWLKYALDVFDGQPMDGIDLRAVVPADVTQIASRQRSTLVAIPDPATEEEIVPKLIARPRVVPLRSSTPVTALQSPIDSPALHGHGDRLGLIRGNLAHKAIELWFSEGERPDLTRVLAINGDSLEAERADAVVSDVDGMLDLLESNPLMQVLNSDKTEAYFELPFAWDWDGVPLHGTIDLAYKTDDGWRVVDFKTDQLRGRTLDEAAAPYLPQLALYSAALEKAVGSRPEAGLLFLRTGEQYGASDVDLRAAMTTTRSRIEVGGLLEVAADEEMLETEP